MTFSGEAFYLRTIRRTKLRSKNWDGDLHNTGVPYFIELSFIVLADIFYKLKVCGNPVSSKLIGGIYPTGSGDTENFLAIKYFLIIV